MNPYKVDWHDLEAFWAIEIVIKQLLVLKSWADFAIYTTTTTKLQQVYTINPDPFIPNEVLFLFQWTHTFKRWFRDLEAFWCIAIIIMKKWVMKMKNKNKLANFVNFSAWSKSKYPQSIKIHSFPMECCLSFNEPIQSWLYDLEAFCAMDIVMENLLVSKFWTDFAITCQSHIIF